MQAPIYDAAPTPAIFLYALLAAAFVIGIILIIRRPKSGSALRLTLYIISALLVGLGVGWYGRTFYEHYQYTHQPPAIDCPTC
jgi:hypothetical protein